MTACSDQPRIESSVNLSRLHRETQFIIVFDWLRPHPLSTELDEPGMPPTTPVDENESRITKCERMCAYVLGKWKVIAFGQVLAFWLVSAC